jgi:beta-lactamase superfamily II metal-dependent hydrolase
MKLEILVWDVNHGNSTSIKLPNGKVIMIDCSSNPETGFSPVFATKRLWNVNRLDYLIISHPHMDHIRDFINMDQLDPRVFYRPRIIDHNELLKGKTGNDLDVVEKYIEYDKRYVEPLTPNEIPTSSSWSGDVTIHNFRLNGEQSDFNNYSSVTFLSYGSFHFAYGADLSSDGWNNLIDQEGTKFTDRLAKVNFFEASHHGRKEGFNTKIFDYMMNPKLTIVSDKQEQDTSVSDRYYKYCKGWDIYNQNTDQWDNGRRVVTTRSDGRIKIEVEPGNGTTEVGVYVR